MLRRHQNKPFSPLKLDFFLWRGCAPLQTHPHWGGGHLWRGDTDIPSRNSVTIPHCAVTNFPALMKIKSRGRPDRHNMGARKAITVLFCKLKIYSTGARGGGRGHKNCTCCQMHKIDTTHGKVDRSASRHQLIAIVSRQLLTLWHAHTEQLNLETKQVSR